MMVQQGKFNVKERAGLKSPLLLNGLFLAIGATSGQDGARQPHDGATSICDGATSSPNGATPPNNGATTTDMQAPPIMPGFI